MIPRPVHPLHGWASINGVVPCLRTIPSDRVTSKGFVWPTVGNWAHDIGFESGPGLGGGLHALPWGMGPRGKLLAYEARSPRWLIVVGFVDELERFEMHVKAPRFFVANEYHLELEARRWLAEAERSVQQRQLVTGVDSGRELSAFEVDRVFDGLTRREFSEAPPQVWYGE